MNKMREEMADAFIKALKEDTIPWERGWTAERPVNAVTGKPYRGVNSLWLSLNAGNRNYTDPRWCTYKQAKDNGWQVKKGEHGEKIEFWSMYDTKEKRKLSPKETRELQEKLGKDFTERVKPISSVYTVFNAEQIEGIPERAVERIPFEEKTLLEHRDVLIKNMGVGFKEGGSSAFYTPALDQITLPAVQDFKDGYSYMATLLHEAGHATGSKKRLDRDLSGTFGSESYAREELRAEIASAFTAQALGIENHTGEHLENHKAYLQSWAAVLEKNPQELFSAIRDADKISDYLMEKGEFDLEGQYKNRVVDGREVLTEEKLNDLEKALNRKALGIPEEIFTGTEGMQQEIFGHLSGRTNHSLQAGLER